MEFFDDNKIVGKIYDAVNDCKVSNEEEQPNEVVRLKASVVEMTVIPAELLIILFL